VFRAYDSTRERLVAVKLFKLDLPPERAHQLVAEFEQLIAANLTHPALVTPLATGISGVSAFLAQDYVAADSLDLAIREYGAAPAGNALRVAAQLADALDLAAAAGVIHGALHPRDVLLSSDDTRLTGLGVARALGKIGVVAPVRRPYSAPERIASGDWDRRADIFSLAALMHELLWGRRVSGLGTKAVASLTEIAGSDLAALREVFARALAEDPHERFESARDFAAALTRACPGVAVAPEPAPVAKRRPVRADEPRLPLDEGPEGAPEALQAFAPAEADVDVPIAAAADREPQFAEEWEVSVAPAAAPEIEYQAVPETHDEPSPQQPRASMPAGFITGYDPDAMSAIERTRSAVWPLVLALVVGIAIGFAGGFFAGSRERSVPTTTIAAAPPPAGPAPAAVTASAPSAPQPNSELRAQNSELRTQTLEPKAQNSAPKNLPSEVSKLKSPASAAEGRLLVRTRPAGARVAVDGKDYGVTPATVRDLARGAHRVQITRDGFAPLERRVVISASRSAQSVSVALVRAPARTAGVAATAGARSTGALAVDSRPAGARVFVDDKAVGRTPMALPSVSAGPHVIRLEHDGYRQWSSSVRIVPSEQHRVTASLER
jgi:protein kinase-like protein/PEGA domain-containing protein